MKLSEFWDWMAWEFGPAYSKVLARDLVLAEFGNITAQQALDSGADVRKVWLAICQLQEVEPSRRLGPDYNPLS